MAACPMCGGGKARRPCPALDKVICATCCGTKRQVTIACPATCRWLAASRAHPHAALQRQQELDTAIAVPLIRGLDEEAYGVLMACLQAAVGHVAQADPRPLDQDLRAAAAALAATAETASRGVLYEHTPESLVAARLARAMSAPLAAAEQAGTPVSDSATRDAMRRLVDILAVFRKGAPAEDAFLAFLGRVLTPRLADARTGQPLAASSDPALAALGGSSALAVDDGPRIIIP